MNSTAQDTTYGDEAERGGMPPAPLARKTMSNVGAVIALAAFGKVLNLATLAVVARLLIPSDFGIVALAVLFVGLLSLANDIGLTPALIQMRGEWESTANAVFWGTILIRAGLYALGFLTAPLVAALFGQPELELVLRVMTLGFLVASLGSVHAALLTRELQFGRLVLVEGLGAALSSGLTVFLAFVGFSYWSLVLGSLWAEPAVVAMLWALHPWRPHRAVDWRALARLWNFGGHITLLNTMGYFVKNLDGYAIGRLLGPAQLGTYTIANRIALFGSASLAAVVNRVLFPTYARIQGDITRLRRGFMRTSFLVASLAMPVSVTVFLLADPLVGFLLGPDWAESVAPLRVLALHGLVLGLVSPAGNVVLALGKVRSAGRATAIQLAFIGGAIYPVTIVGGITGTAVVVLLGVALGGISLLTSAIRMLGIGTAEFAGNLSSIVLGSGVMAGLVILVLPFSHSLEGFLLVTGIGTVAYAIVVQLASGGRLGSEARSLIDAVIGKAKRD